MVIRVIFRHFWNARQTDYARSLGPTSAGLDESTRLILDAYVLRTPDFAGAPTR